MFPFNQIVYHYVEQHGPEHGSASDFPALWKPTIYSCFNIFVINSPCKAVGFLKMPLRYPVINLTVFHKGYPTSTDFLSFSWLSPHKYSGVFVTTLSVQKAACSVLLLYLTPKCLLIIPSILVSTAWNFHPYKYLTDWPVVSQLLSKASFKNRFLYLICSLCHIESILGERFYAVIWLQITWVNTICSWWFVTTHLSL